MRELDSMNIYSNKKNSAKQAKQSEKIFQKVLRFEGYNKDITETYYWHLNFAYYTGKGWFPIKLEDQHYFSENNQFGSGVRQIKGGSIRAFQENLTQLIQLIKVHLMPLLKEVKESEYYKSWMDTIVDNDNLYRGGLKNNKPRDDPDMVKWASERDEAINHVKDKWVNEVDGGRLWKMSASAQEGGLDFVLVPQLFFGTKLDDPLQRDKTLKEQLDEYIYKIDITTEASSAVARFHYRFYSWLPTAIKEVNSTFKIKVSALKQIFSQVQIYIKFMKPLLLEINKKAEGIESSSWYKGFENENPEFVNLFDYSYSYVRILGVKGIRQDRGGEGLPSLEMLANGGYFIAGRYIKWGPYKGKPGIISGYKIKSDGKPDFNIYRFKLAPDKMERDEAMKLSAKEINELKEVELDKEDLEKFPIQEWEFSQRRRPEMVKTSQGPQQVPLMLNKIIYTAYAWNIYEISTYREKILEEDLELLETFIEEISVMKEDILKYTQNVEQAKPISTEFDLNSKGSSSSSGSNSSDSSLFLSPLKGIGSLVSPLIPSFKSSSSSKSSSNGGSSNRDEEHEIVIAAAAEETWKVYSIHKKANGYIQY